MLIVKLADSPLLLAGDAEGDALDPGGGGGGGGGAGRRGGLQSGELTYYMDIATLVAPVDVPPEPVVDFADPVPPELIVPPLAMEVPALEPVLPGTPLDGGAGSGEGAGTGSGTGGGSGSGTGAGTGPGQGVGAGEGGTIRPPEPIALLIPPMAPSSLRGREIRVRLQVDVAGRVTAVELVTSSGNARYDRELRRTAEGWRFRPARDPGGRAVAHVFEYTVGL